MARDYLSSVKYCERCGKELVGVGNMRKFCEECYVINTRERNRLNERKRLARLAHKEAHQKKHDHLTEVVLAAEKAGMSYGKYQAMRYSNGF